MATEIIVTNMNRKFSPLLEIHIPESIPSIGTQARGRKTRAPLTKVSLLFAISNLIGVLVMIERDVGANATYPIFTVISSVWSILYAIEPFRGCAKTS
jgi:hypothetical protein